MRTRASNKDEQKQNRVLEREKREGEKEKREGGERTCGEELGDVKVPEDGEAVDEDEDGEPADTPVREVGLERVVVHELLAVEALCTEAAV